MKHDCDSKFSDRNFLVSKNYFFEYLDKHTNVQYAQKQKGTYLCNYLTSLICTKVNYFCSYLKYKKYIK